MEKETNKSIISNPNKKVEVPSLKMFKSKLS